MKKATLICLIIALCLSSCAFAEETDAIMPADRLQDKLENCPYYIYLLDIRSVTQYRNAHIPYAYSIPLDKLYDTMLDVLYTSFTYMAIEVTVCGETAEEEREGVRILRELGFTNVYRLDTLSSWRGRTVSAEDDLRILGYIDTLDIYGNNIDQTVLKGHKVTMINVWATYWNPCMNELTTLGRLNREYGGEDFQVIGLVSDVLDASLSLVEDKVVSARKIAAETQADYPHLLPSRDLFWKVIGQLNAMPTTFFVDETGLMIGQVVIGSRTYEEWVPIIEDMIGGANQAEAGM
ncbi:MAG: redoxin domain-containing protein [Clostridia bacterium]|nr:redoxin domain-containing protein [Clostridia bacterium]